MDDPRAEQLSNYWQCDKCDGYDYEHDDEGNCQNEDTKPEQLMTLIGRLGGQIYLLENKLEDPEIVSARMMEIYKEITSS